METILIVSSRPEGPEGVPIDALGAVQKTCLWNEFHQLTLRATVQRAYVYEPGADERGRTAFRASLRRFLDDISGGYRTTISEASHLANIRRLADELSKAHASVLRGRRFRIGPAQKALNLFLKYQWCAGWIATPPHCPFDAVIINCLPLRPRPKWTELDDMRAYEQLVAVARTEAGAMTLAEWELRTYGAESNSARVAS